VPQDHLAPLFNKMLKQVSSFVLPSKKSLTYPRGYASGFFSAAASLDDLFEHLEDGSTD
jgi:hypothetical protein